MPKPIRKTASKQKPVKKPARRPRTDAELQRSILTRIARLGGTYNGKRVYLDGDEPTFISPYLE